MSLLKQTPETINKYIKNKIDNLKRNKIFGDLLILEKALDDHEILYYAENLYNKDDKVKWYTYDELFDHLFGKWEDIQTNIGVNINKNE